MPPTECIYQVSNWYLKACWRKVRKTRTDGRTDRRTDGHCHGIIRPFFKRAYKNPTLNIVFTTFLWSLQRFPYVSIEWAVWRWDPGGGTHYMKVTTYAPPFRPPFFKSLENLYSFDPYILAKIRKMSYFDPYFSSKLGKMYSFDPPFLTLVAFRVDGRCWASLSKTRPSTPPGDGTTWRHKHPMMHW